MNDYPHSLFTRNILTTIDRLFLQMTRIHDFSEVVCGNQGCNSMLL